MYQIWNKKSVTNSEICFITPWCPANELEWYRVIILSAHISGITKRAVSLPGIVVNLNSRESNKIYFSASIFLLLPSYSVTYSVLNIDICL